MVKWNGRVSLPTRRPRSPSTTYHLGHERACALGPKELVHYVIKFAIKKNWKGNRIGLVERMERIQRQVWMSAKRP